MKSFLLVDVVQNFLVFPGIYTILGLGKPRGLCVLLCIYIYIIIVFIIIIIIPSTCLIILIIIHIDIVILVHCVYMYVYIYIHICRLYIYIHTILSPNMFVLELNEIDHYAQNRTFAQTQSSLSHKMIVNPLPFYQNCFTGQI